MRLLVRVTQEGHFLLSCSIHTQYLRSQEMNNVLHSFVCVYLKYKVQYFQIMHLSKHNSLLILKAPGWSSIQSFSFHRHHLCVLRLKNSRCFVEFKTTHFTLHVNSWMFSSSTFFSALSPKWVNKLCPQVKFNEVTGI